MNKKCGHAKQLASNHYENSGLNQNTQIVHTSFDIGFSVIIMQHELRSL